MSRSGWSKSPLWSVGRLAANVQCVFKEVRSKPPLGWSTSRCRQPPQRDSAASPLAQHSTCPPGIYAFRSCWPWRPAWISLQCAITWASCWGRPRDEKTNQYSHYLPPLISVASVSPAISNRSWGLRRAPLLSLVGQRDQEQSCWSSGRLIGSASGMVRVMWEKRGRRVCWGGSQRRGRKEQSNRGIDGGWDTEKGNEGVKDLGYNNLWKKKKMSPREEKTERDGEWGISRGENKHQARKCTGPCNFSNPPGIYTFTGQIMKMENFRSCTGCTGLFF